MKTEDFDKIKDLFNKNGFKIVNLGNNLNGIGYFAVSEMDIWEGVEFAESNWSGRIYRIENESNFPKEKAGFKPSTEQAYIDYLKAKSFKLYWEIKEGDRFDCSIMGYSKDTSILLSSNPEWDYRKISDELNFEGFAIYKAGKWAKKLPPKRAEVEVRNEVLSNIDENSHIYTVSFKIENMGEKGFSYLHDYTNQVLRELLQNHINNK